MIDSRRVFTFLGSLRAFPFHSLQLAALLDDAGRLVACPFAQINLRGFFSFPDFPGQVPSFRIDQERVAKIDLTFSFSYLIVRFFEHLKAKYFLELVLVLFSPPKSRLFGI